MDLNKFYSFCLQGNVLKAMKYLEEKGEGSEAEIMKQQYEERFYKEFTPFKFHTGDERIEKILNYYYVYYQKVLTGQVPEYAEKELALNLSRSLGQSSEDMEELEEKLKLFFEKKGYSFLGGKTPPYYGPYIWKNTEKRSFEVTLPEGKEKVEVYFLSEFLMLSWAHFATFGKRHTGGFAKPEGLYYISAGDKIVDINSSRFQVWFLKHEAQHIRDYKQFRNLDPKNLEYRAKLVELIYTPEPQELIHQFSLQAKPDKNLPHPYAAYVLIEQVKKRLRIKEELMAGLEQISNDFLKDIALALFLENSKELKELGEETEGII